MTSIVFMVTRGMADAVRVFATAIPVSLILGDRVPREWAMPSAIIVLGVLTIIYTYRGGMRAVVWTEILQASVYLLGGFSAIVILGNAVPGGWDAILARAGDARETHGARLLVRPEQATHDLGGHHRWRLPFDGLTRRRPTHRAAPPVVEEPSRSAARDHWQRHRRVRADDAVHVRWHRTLGALQRTEHLHPRLDAIFPRFIVEQMPAGLVGLLKLAAVTAATMSTHPRDQRARRGNDPRHRHAVDQPTAEDRGDVPRRTAVRADLGCRADRRALLFKTRHTRWVRDRAGDRELYLRRSAGCVFPRKLLAASHATPTRSGAFPSGFIVMAFVVFAAQSPAVPGNGRRAGTVRAYRLALVRSDGTSITMIVGIGVSLVRESARWCRANEWSLRGCRWRRIQHRVLVVDEQGAEVGEGRRSGRRDQARRHVAFGVGDRDAVETSVRRPGPIIRSAQLCRRRRWRP